MNKRNGIYLILGIVVLISIGFLVYYFNNLSDGVKYINTINQDDDNLVDTNEDYENDDDVNNNSENIDLDSNDNNTIIDESNQDNNENHIGEYCCITIDVKHFYNKKVIQVV